MRRLILTTLSIGAMLACALAGDIAVLYDPDAVEGTTQTLVDQGDDDGFWALSNLLDQEPFYSAGDGVTDFDSGPENGQIVAFFTHGLITGDRLHPEAQILDRNDGFRLSIDLAFDAEVHDPTVDANADGVADGAGFSIAIVSSDLNGIGIAFWQDRVWVFEDDSDGEDQLLTQAEGVHQNPASMATLRRYDIEVKGDGYRVRVDGEVILTGLLRDYSNFEGRVTQFGFILNNFDKPNSITLGDAIETARSVVRIGDITSETPYDPPPVENPTAEIDLVDGGIRLRWDAIPGTLYSLRESDDLSGFIEFNDFMATSFVGEFIDVRSLAARKFYEIAPVESP